MEKGFIGNNRIMSFDLLKLFAIFLVIWGHVVQWLLSSESSVNSVYRVLNSFHVALFMMISGYFAASSMKLTVVGFVIKKFKQLIYPCFVWGLLTLIIIYLLAFVDNKIVLSDYGIIQFFVDLYWYSDFWFLKSCFICYCLLFAGSHLRLRNRYWIILTLIISQLVPPFQVPFMYPCFVVGFVMKGSHSFRMMIRRNSFLIIGCFLFMLLFWDKTAWCHSRGLSVDLFRSGLLNILDVFFYRLYRLLIGIFGALAFCSLAINISNEKIQHSYVCKISCWGGYTLEIYILQAMILERFLSHIIRFDYMNIFLFNYVVSPIIAAIMSFVCILFIWLLIKSRSMMIFLFGREIIRLSQDSYSCTTLHDKAPQPQ